jgi:hypothetical protein
MCYAKCGKTFGNTLKLKVKVGHFFCKGKTSEEERALIKKELAG